MEAKIVDQEEELDEQQGAIQQLEQAKLRLQMQGEKERSKWMRELAEKESEMDDLRFHTQKKIRAVEMQLEEESEISGSLQREKRELERRLKEFGDIGKKSSFMLTINSHGGIDRWVGGFLVCRVRVMQDVYEIVLFESLLYEMERPELGFWRKHFVQI